MTRKIYKSAMGKTVDLGSLILQNEATRAVGNMNVNARGDRLDGNNRVIDQKNRQVQRQYRKTTNVSGSIPVATSNRAAKQAAAEAAAAEANETLQDVFEDIDTPAIDEEVLEAAPEPVAAPEPLADNTFGPTGGGGLAAAIARSRLVKQEKEKTLRERQQAQGLRKI